MWCGLGIACSAPATLSELRLAEQRADAGDVDGAVTAYRAAQTRCGALRPARFRRVGCQTPPARRNCRKNSHRAQRPRRILYKQALSV